jgi:hypothetical protein
MTEIIELFFMLPRWSVLTISFLMISIWGLIIYAIRDYISASREFRNAIYAELEGLYPTPVKWPSESMQIVSILRDKFPPMEIAVNKFRGHLVCCIRKRFDAAWQKYHEDYFQYVPIKSRTTDERGVVVSSFDNTVQYKEEFKHNVDDLMRFAKPS